MGLKKITRRIKRLISGNIEESPTSSKMINPTIVVSPEDVIPLHGKPPPTRKYSRAELFQTETEITREEDVSVCKLPGGITHIRFHAQEDTVVGRDPITKRLSRKRLREGMKRTTSYYDQQGKLLEEFDAEWR